MSPDHAATLVVRLGLVMLFLPFSALDKVLNHRGAVDQAAALFQPRALAEAVILAGLGIEVVMSLGVVTGIADRLAALVIAGYSAATAVLFKRFWEPGDFWVRGASRARDLFWDFMKNLSLGAGFLLVTIQPDGHGLALLLADPLGSTRPYGR